MYSLLPSERAIWLTPLLSATKNKRWNHPLSHRDQQVIPMPSAWLLLYTCHLPFPVSQPQDLRLLLQRGLCQLGVHLLSLLLSVILLSLQLSVRHVKQACDMCVSTFIAVCSSMNVISKCCKLPHPPCRIESHGFPCWNLSAVESSSLSPCTSEFTYCCA